LRGSEVSFQSWVQEARSETGIVYRVNPPLVDHDAYWRGIIGDWQDEWDLKRRVSYRGVNTHDTCRAAAQLDHRLQWIAEKAGSH